jgi:DNA repair exonuclease SbcCD nuclease subunit
MKILFSADWHIKLGQKNVPVEWQLNRYKELVTKLTNIECDLQIVGGDIFDRVPTLDELAIFTDFVGKCNTKTIIYAGNHEAISKHTTFLSKLKVLVKNLNPLVEIVDEIISTDEFDIIPYNRLKKWAEAYQDYDFQNKILFTHVRGEIPPHVTPEVNLDLFNGWSVVFAGDLHSHDNSQRNIVYPGSPVTTSFHRAEVQNGCILIDTDIMEYEWINLELPQLLRKTITDVSEMVKTDFHHTVYEITDGVENLNKIENSELLDKKLRRNSSEATLILSDDMTMEEELSEFLSYIMEIEPIKVKELLKVYHDHIS